jgi:hypothetical protein
MTRHSTSRTGDDNRVYGMDGNIRFFGRLDWNSYVLRTDTPGVTSGQYAWRTTVNFENNFFHGKGGVMSIGDHFRNDLGYYRRIGTRKWLMDVGVRPRPKSLAKYGVREIHPHAVWDYYTDQQNVPTAKKFHTGLTVFMQSGSYAELSVNPRYERIAHAVRLNPGAPPVRAGSYGWTEYQLKGQSDASRAVSVQVTGIAGGLWSGTQRTVNATVTVRPSYRFRVSAGTQWTRASLERPRADFISSIWTVRANYSFSTRMFVDTLMQYSRDTRQINTNVRFNLIHHPLSDVLVVYNEQRFTTPDSPVPGRGLVVKVTHMLSF